MRKMTMRKYEKKTSLKENGLEVGVLFQTKWKGRNQ